MPVLPLITACFHVYPRFVQIWPLSIIQSGGLAWLRVFNYNLHTFTCCWWCFPRSAFNLVDWFEARVSGLILVCSGSRFSTDHSDLFITFTFVKTVKPAAVSSKDHFQNCALHDSSCTITVIWAIVAISLWNSAAARLNCLFVLFFFPRPVDLFKDTMESGWIARAHSDQRDTLHQYLFSRNDRCHRITAALSFFSIVFMNV